MTFGLRGPSLGAVLLLCAAALALLGGADCGGNGSLPGAGESGGADRTLDREVAARVVDVVDGDTIEVELDGREEDVRYIGIDTPESVTPGEPVECYGEAASDFNASLVGGRRVRLRFDAELRDPYGRLLAYVYVGGELVNAELVERGYARTLEIEPNTAKAPLLGRLERAAGRGGRGLWSACG